MESSNTTESFYLLILKVRSSGALPALIRTIEALSINYIQSSEPVQPYTMKIAPSIYYSNTTEQLDLPILKVQSAGALRKQGVFFTRTQGAVNLIIVSTVHQDFTMVVALLVYPTERRHTRGRCSRGGLRHSTTLMSWW